jgi:hypothetical protein
MEQETWTWEELERNRRDSGKRPAEIEVECLLRDLDPSNLVAPLREVRQALAQPGGAFGQAEDKCRAALELQEQWDAWLERRDLLRSEIKRGKECLDQVQRELAAVRARLEEWPAYERTCGKNPVFEEMEQIRIRESLTQFLPGWLNRREEQLKGLVAKMELCARQNGLEHLL